MLESKEEIMRVFVFVAWAVLAAACSSVTIVDDAAPRPPVAATKVKVLYKEPTQPYEVVALVSYEAATRFASVGDVIQKCRELAADAGADAIVITSTYDQGSNYAAKASGRAIRWVK